MARVASLGPSVSGLGPLKVTASESPWPLVASDDHATGYGPVTLSYAHVASGHIPTHRSASMGVWLL